MNLARRTLLLSVGLLLAFGATARAQTTTYHLHREDSGDFFCGKSLLTSATEPPSLALQSADLKNQPGGSVGTFACFQTPTSPPNFAGTIPANSTVTFKLWMKKTASWGVIYPYAVLRLASGTDLCSATDTSDPLATTFPLNVFTFSCTTPSTPITTTSTDKLRLFVGYSISATNPPGNHSVKAELDIETGFDSQVIAPNPIPPTITSIAPTAGPVNWSVTLTGTHFGTSGTVKFGTTAATQIASWNDTTIVASVPTGLTVGSVVPVTVTVGGATATCPSSPCFTIKGPPSLTSVSPASAHRGEAVTIVGTNLMTAAPSSSVTFGGTAALAGDTTTWNDTTIVTKVPPTATAGPVVVTVAGTQSNSLNFTVIIPGPISGTITKASGSTPLQGATLQAVLSGVIKATATTAVDGTYSLSNLDPATYDVRVLATGYSSEVRSTVLPNNSSATVNVAMYHPGTIAGKVTQIDGITPIVGAAVTVFSGPIQKGAANTNGTGDYSIANLHPGTFTVQAVNVGNRTKEQSAAVTENTTTTANLSLDLEPAGPVLYAYDAIGRLVQVTDPSGDAAIYRYDAVGNITAILRTGTTAVSISGFTPTSGAIGFSVTISGTGFSATPGQNAVTFGCGTGCTVPATVTSATATQLVVTVPATAVTSVIAVAAQGQTANAPGSFTVTAAGAAPTITGFTPTLTVAGSALTVTGTNFDSTPANDRMTTNVASAQVTSAAPTSLQAAVPITTTGRVSVLTQNGSATSTDYLWVAPAPYAVTDVESTGSITLGTATSIPVNSAGKIAMRAFDNTQGHRASVSVTNATFAAGGSVAIYGVYANPTSTGFASTGFLEPVDLRETGTYTFILAPNSPNTGSATVTVYDVPPDVTGPIVSGGAGVPVSLTVPGQNAWLTFSGAANGRVCVATSIPTIASGSLKLLNPDSSPLGSVGFNSGVAGFLDARTLPSSGTYTVVVDPDTTSTGSTTVNLYGVLADFTGSVAMNGNSLAVPLSTCENGSVTFSGTQNQQATVHVTGNTFATVTVKLLSSDGQTVLSQFTSSGASFDLAPATLPTLGTATYTISIDPATTASGTLTVSVTGS